MTRYIIVLLVAGCHREASSGVTVWAAASLQGTLNDARYRAQFGASSTLARQIAEGAPVDVFISADAAWADHVKPLDRYDWVGNRLVVVARREAAFISLAEADTIAMAGEGVPAGKLAIAALKRLGVTPKRVIHGDSVRDVLSKVSAGAASVGFVYATDAAIDPDLKVVMPLEERTRYVVCLLTTRGRHIFDILRDAETIELMRQKGFE